MCGQLVQAVDSVLGLRVAQTVRTQGQAGPSHPKKMQNHVILEHGKAG